MIGQSLADRYEVRSELGRGGMGVVYRAHDPLLGRDVAVKVISLAGISADAEERFRREAQLVAGMDHAAIVPIFDLGAHQDYLFFVMPVVEGTTLQTLIRQRSLRLGDTLEIIAQVADALDYSHAKKVVHRDVKPENVMVTWEEDSAEPSGGQYPRARVMDFGLALVGATSRLTKTGKLPGTLHYLSPEQILSADIDGRSDLYSLGTILYECITGETPFSGSRYSLLYRIAHEPVPKLETSALDERLSGVILSCLAKRPDERPQRGGELAEALRGLRAELGRGSRRQAIGERGRGGHAASGVTPLAGRARETAELHQRLDQAFARGCRLVAVGGEAGMGKTRLLRYLEEVARSLPLHAEGEVLVLHGRFSTQDAFPYQGFGELIQDGFRKGRGTDRPAAVDEGDLRDLAADLLALFPALQGVREISAAALAAAGPSLSVAAAAADRTRIFELLARTLARLAAGRPLLILLEQIHASEASIEALQYIVRRLGPTPTLIAGTYRPSETDRRHPLARLLRGVKDDPRFTSIVLEPLTEAEHRELLATLLAGSQMSDELVEKLYRASEGNPFFIQEWVTWLLETRDIWRGDDGTWVLSSEAVIAHDALPESIQQAIESRLEQMPEIRLRLLRTASILGPDFDFADLEGLAGGQIDDAVDELIRESLLEEVPRSREDRLTFSSRLVRETLYRALPRRRRRLLHRRHAERLEARFAGRLHRVYGRLVHHFSAGDAPAKTVSYALDLARSALDGFGWEAAIRAVRTALDFVAGDPEGARAEGELRRLLAAALRAEGQLESALKEAGRAVRVAQRAGEAEEGAAAALLAAEIAWQGRKVEQTRKWVAKGSGLARGAGASACLRQLLTLGATLANLGGEYGEARALLEEAGELGESGRRRHEDEAVPTGGTVTATLSGPLASDDPAAASTSEESEVLANVFETLLTSDAEGNLMSTLAREWEGSARGRVFRFELRSGVCFSDGTPLAASDVKLSFERAARRGEAPACRALAAIEADDGERVVEFQLREPLPIFPALLSDLRTAVVREAEEGSPRLGTGPFRWPRGSAPLAADRVLLERNPNYWGGDVPLDRLEFRILPHASEVAWALRSGEIDLGRDLMAQDLEEILRDPRFRSGLVEAAQRNVYYVLFNGSGPLTRHREVRRALVGAVRVQDVVWRTLGRFAHPATGLIPPGVLGHDPGRRLPELGRERSRELLAARAPVRLRGAAHPQLMERYGALLDALFEEWSALGVRVEVEPLAADAPLAGLADPAGLDFCFGRWDLDYADPDSLTYEMLHSRSGRLSAYLVSGEADTWIERARQQVQAAHRQRLYRKIESLVAEQAILLPLFHDIQSRVVSPRLAGLRLSGSPPFVNYAEIGKAAGAGAPPRFSSRGLRKTGTVHVPLPAVVASLAPERAVMFEASEVVPNVFETLTRVEEGAHVVPCLASEFAVEGGGRRFRFRLRQNVRFHDGRRLTVRDVRYSFERLLTVSRDGAETPLLPIRGARALRAGLADQLEGFRIVSARELVLELEKPTSHFPAMLTSPTAAVVPEGVEDFNGNWRQGPSGTGPFRVVRLLPGERIELEANPHYWRSGYPRCDRLIFELGLPAARIAADFRHGQLALASDLRPEDLESLRRDPELAAGYCELPGFSTYYLVLNGRQGLLADRRRRRALASLLDVEGAVRETLGRVAVAAQGLIPPGLLGQDARHAEPPSPDLASALAGLELSCVAHPAYRGSYQPFWQRLTKAFATLGVELRVVYQELEKGLSVSGEADLFATRWLADYPDSATFVHPLHSSEGIDGRLCGHPEMDRLIELGQDETNPVRRHAVYRQIEQRLRREALIVPLFHEQIYRFARPEITGLRLGIGSPQVAYEELALAP